MPSRAELLRFPRREESGTFFRLCNSSAGETLPFQSSVVTLALGPFPLSRAVSCLHYRDLVVFLGYHLPEDLSVPAAMFTLAFPQCPENTTRRSSRVRELEHWERLTPGAHINPSFPSPNPFLAFCRPRIPLKRPDPPPGFCKCCRMRRKKSLQAAETPPSATRASNCLCPGPLPSLAAVVASGPSPSLSPAFLASFVSSSSSFFCLIV